MRPGAQSIYVYESMLCVHVHVKLATCVCALLHACVHVRCVCVIAYVCDVRESVIASLCVHTCVCVHL